MQHKYTFKKSERLCSRKEIQSLFNNANSFSIYPFRILWLPINYNGQYTAKILIAIPSKNIRKAVTRNLLKRRIKESYRKNKYELIDFLINNKISCNVAFIYNAKDITNYKEIESKIILILQRLKKELASMNPSIQNFVNCK